MKYIKHYNIFENTNSIVSNKDIIFLSKNENINKGFIAFNNFYNNKKCLRCDFSGIDKYNLTLNEAKILFSYTYSGYKELKLNDYNILYKNLLILILNKIPNYSGVIYRNVDIENNFYKGEILYWENISSCSKIEDVAKSFNKNTTFQIYTKYGKDISNISIYSDEEEVILMPGIFEVLDIKDDKILLIHKK